MSISLIYKGLLALPSVPTISAALDISCSDPCETIQKDIVIVGGGAAGSHAAVRLREDYNKTVIVVEREAKLVSTVELSYNIQLAMISNSLQGRSCQHISRPRSWSVS